MKSNRITNALFFLLCLLLLPGIGCKKQEGIPADKIPLVETGGVAEITITTAITGGGILADNDYTITDRGVCWSMDINPSINDKLTHDGAGAGGYISYITGLSGGTRYYVRAYATNAAGTGYGSTMSFVTEPPVLPEVSTDSIQSIATTSATCKGSVTSTGGAEVTDKGICWGTASTPTIDDQKISAGPGIGTFSCNLSGLMVNTLYYVRAYGTNSKGTSYGQQIIFRTKPVYSGTITDIDGNVYNTIKIGSQTWMAENLKTMHFNDGSTINLLTDANAWMEIREQAYCWYNNDAGNKNSCGALYNWFATTATGALCPTGWHVPTYPDWTQLVNTLGGIDIAASKMIEGEFNSSGFTAKLCGSRSWNGTFGQKETDAAFWSTTIEPTSTWLMIWNLRMGKLGDGENVYSEFRIDYRTEGYSVRCVKD